MRTTLNIDDDLLKKAAKLNWYDRKDCTRTTWPGSVNRVGEFPPSRSFGGHREEAEADTPASSPGSVMTLVDTSVWIGHFRKGNDRLATMLDEGEVLCHQFVIGELACGSLRNRDELLGLLGALPATPVAEHDEVLSFLTNRRLAGKGLGWIDVHLLASALLANCRLWTLDKALSRAVSELKLSSP